MSDPEQTCPSSLHATLRRGIRLVLLFCKNRYDEDLSFFIAEFYAFYTPISSYEWTMGYGEDANGTEIRYLTLEVGMGLGWLEVYIQCLRLTLCLVSYPSGTSFGDECRRSSSSTDSLIW